MPSVVFSIHKFDKGGRLSVGRIVFAFFAHGPAAADRSHVRDFRILRSALRARRQFSYGALGRRLSEAAFAATAVATAAAAEGFAGAITSFPASVADTAAAAVGERKVIIGPSSHFHGTLSHSLWFAIDKPCTLSDLPEYVAL